MISSVERPCRHGLATKQTGFSSTAHSRASAHATVLAALKLDSLPGTMPSRSRTDFGS
jgi:hypothetical protein